MSKRRINAGTTIAIRGPGALAAALALTAAPKAYAPPSPVPCSERMPPEREHVLMWETPSLRWSVGSWMSEYQQWSNRDDPEYAIHPHQVSHWMPLPDAIGR